MSSYFGGSWAVALRRFVEDDLNCWCPVWIRRNYEVLNPLEPEPELLADDPPRDSAPRFVFECTDERLSSEQPAVDQDDEVSRAPAASTQPDAQAV